MCVWRQYILQMLAACLIYLSNRQSTIILPVPKRLMVKINASRAASRRNENGNQVVHLLSEEAASDIKQEMLHASNPTR